SSRSGCWSSRRQSATRRRSPPDSVFTVVSGGGQRSASIATSSWRSSSQALAASMRSWRRPCSASSFSISSSDIGSPSFVEASSKRTRRSRLAAPPSSTPPPRQGVGAGGAGLLQQQSAGGALGRNRLAGDVVVEARHDAEQRALTGAVVTEHADLRSGVEGEPDALQDLLPLRRDLPEILHGEDELGHERLPSTRRRVGCQRASQGTRRSAPAC